MHVLPGNIFFCEIAKHNPGGFAPAHCHDKSAASSNRVSGFFSDELCSRECDGIGIGIEFNLHHAASLATLNAFLSPGLLQPLFGVTRSTSFGPKSLARTDEPECSFSESAPRFAMLPRRSPS